jgi:hypothetical protein
VTPIQPGPDLSGYAPTYFPGTTNAGAAQLVLEQQSQDVTGLGATTDDVQALPRPTNFPPTYAQPTSWVQPRELDVGALVNF